MPATRRRNQGKTAFVRDVLENNPYANARVVQEEWTNAGHGGTISQTLVNKQRSLMGLAGNIRGGRPARSESVGDDGNEVGGPKVRAGVRPAQLSQLEADLDRLLFRVMSLGGLENIEESLRRTRRLLYGVPSR